MYNKGCTWSIAFQNKYYFIRYEKLTIKDQGFHFMGGTNAYKVLLGHLFSGLFYISQGPRLPGSKTGHFVAGQQHEEIGEHFRDRDSHQFVSTAGKG